MGRSYKFSESGTWYQCRRGARMISCIALSFGIAACAVAPGMRMPASATLPTGSSDAQGQQADLQIPIVDINTALVKKLHDNSDQMSTDQTRELSGQAGPYTLGPGDVLQITVWDHPELAAALGAQNQGNARPFDPGQGFVVDNSGNIQFPYAGSIHVTGLRVEQAQQAVYAELSKVFIKPQLTVRVASFRAKQIYVDGEVRAPGAVPVNDIPLTLYEAINRAGGFSTTADQSRMVLVRNGVSYRLNLSRMLESDQNPSSILLKNGDLLRVVSRDDNGVFVMGEVNRPVTAVPMKSGKLTLSDALSQAGSLNTASADAAQLYVIRGSSNSQPEVFHLDAHSPVSMILANQFELQPKDVVYVDGNGLVRFSRVLSLLLPAINAGLTTLRF